MNCKLQLTPNLGKIEWYFWQLYQFKIHNKKTDYMWQVLHENKYLGVGNFFASIVNSSLFFWFVYFRIDDVYKVKAVIIMVLDRPTGLIHRYLLDTFLENWEWQKPNL